MSETPETERMETESQDTNTDSTPMDTSDSSSNDIVLGIDFGSQTCVVAATRKGQGLPVLIANNLSNLSTPNVVSFRGNERVIGEEAANRMISDVQSTVSLTKLLLGKSYSDLSQELIQSLPYKLQDANGKLVVSVNYGDEGESKFTIEQITAMMLKRLVYFATKETKAEKPIKRAVIAIPSIWGPKEKRAMLDSAAIAGIEVAALISENTAVALQYGYTHDLEEGAPPRNVAIVNLGHQYFTAQIVQYTKGQLKVLSSACESGIGGHIIDDKLVEHFAEEFKKRYGVDASKNAKARVRLARACEKAKKVLSTIPETDLELDCLMDDIFVKGKIQRSTMEELIADQLQKIKDLSKAAIEKSQIKLEDISDVEIVGGGVRIPSVQAAISEAFGGKELSKHIDGTSAVAEGSAIDAAIKTSGFEFTYTIVDEFQNEDVPVEGLDAASLQQAIDREAAMEAHDQVLLEIQAKKNGLETLLYDLRDKVSNGSFRNEVGDKKDDLLQFLQSVENWLYEDGEEANKEQLDNKLQEINQTIASISPAFSNKLAQLKEQKEKEIAAAALERERLASQPSTSSRDKTEKPLTKKEKFEATKKRKNQGNIAFKDGDFEGAASRYVGAITLADEIMGQCSDEEKAELKDIKLTSFLNIAMCCLKLNNNDKTIDMCKKALEIDQNNVKALFRRAHAYRNKKEYEFALSDLVRASKVEPENADVQKAIAQVKVLIEDQKKKERAAYSRMFQ